VRGGTPFTSHLQRNMLRHGRDRLRSRQASGASMIQVINHPGSRAWHESASGPHPTTRRLGGLVFALAAIPVPCVVGLLAFKISQRR
jgi:hypothetical protein